MKGCCKNSLPLVFGIETSKFVSLPPMITNMGGCDTNLKFPCHRTEILKRQNFKKGVFSPTPFTLLLTSLIFTKEEKNYLDKETVPWAARSRWVTPWPSSFSKPFLRISWCLKTLSIYVSIWTDHHPIRWWSNLTSWELPPLLSPHMASWNGKIISDNLRYWCKD